VRGVPVQTAFLITSFAVNAPTWAELEALSFTIGWEAILPSRKNYDSALRAFISFCALYSIIFPPVGPSAVSIICCYYAFIIARGLKFASISAGRSAISEYYLLRGLISPCNHEVAVFKYVRTKAWCTLMRPVLRARPVPPPIIARVAASSLAPPPHLARWYFAFALLAVSAVRTGTLLALMPSDFSFSPSFVRIKWRVIKKRSLPVTSVYALSPTAWPQWALVLKRFLLGKSPNLALFEGVDGRELGRRVRELCVRAGMKVEACTGLSRVVPRSLRRAAAQRAFDAGASESDIAILLMHRSTIAQEPYLHDGPGNKWRLVFSLSVRMACFCRVYSESTASLVNRVCFF
jgi:integrase